MPLDSPQADPQQPGFTIRKKDRQWFVTAPDATTIGPCFNGRTALQIAIAWEIRGRQPGLKTSLLVQDNRGRVRECAIADLSSPDRPCDACQSVGPNGLPSCPLAAELRPVTLDAGPEAVSAVAKSHPKRRESSRQVIVTLVLLGALLSTGWLVAPRLSHSFDPSPPERITGRVVAPTSDGGCEQFEYDNNHSTLTPKGAVRCERLVDRGQTPMSALSTDGTRDSETGNDSSERFKHIRDHFNQR